MRLFIQLENALPKAWALAWQNVISLAPSGVSFPNNEAAYESVDLSEFALETFTDVAQPAFNALTQQVVEATPVQVAGQWTRQWSVADLAADQIAANRKATRAALVAKIDAAVIAVYNKPLLLSKEYEQRESQAQAFKDAGYTGTVPPRVDGFATPSGMTAQAATDLILSQASQLHSALDSLSDLRMKKYAITRTDPVTGQYVLSDADAQASADSTLASIASIAASLG